MNVDKFKQDHVEILAGIKGLRTLVRTDMVGNADAIATTINSMSSAIKLHLAAEDRLIYPKLVNSTNVGVAELGKAFQHEMGGLAAVYAEFSRKWCIGSRIAADPDAFRDDANRVFKALHERIQRENCELYPLIERIGTHERPQLRPAMQST